MNNSLDYAGLVKAIRKKMKLTQEQLARELDVTLGTISGWESAKHRPIASLKKRLVEMAKSAGLDVSSFSKQ